VTKNIPKTPAVLPESLAEFSAPCFVGIESFHVLVVKPVKSFLGRNPPGDENKIQAVHQPPVFEECPLFLDGLPERCAGKRCEFGHVHVIESQRDDKSDVRLMDSSVSPGNPIIKSPLARKPAF